MSTAICVLRLQHALSEEMLERIRTEFADILVAGTFEQTEALPEEANDTHLAASAAPALPLRPPEPRPAAPAHRRDQPIRRFGKGDDASRLASHPCAG